ncbi:MAG: MucR family transcriptional regulator [Pseudomonadota bacterium]
MPDDDAISLATELTVAWLSNPSTRASAEDVTAFLVSMRDAVADLSVPAAEPVTEEPAHVPAVSVRKSLASPDFIVSLLDGKPYKTLRRHLARHGLTPEQYRERFGLKPDYPIVAATYSAARKAMAKAIGLGRKEGERPAAKQAAGRPQKAAAAAKAKSGRMTATEAKKAAQAHLGGKL